MIVVDASVMVPIIVDPSAPAASLSRRLVAEDMVAPELLDLEVAHAVRGLLIGGRIDDVQATKALRSFDAAQIERFSHRPLLPRIWELRDNLTAYDGAYVALAEFLECPLITGDVRLASAPGVRCSVEVIR